MAGKLRTLWLGSLPYAEALTLQEEQVRKIRAGEEAEALYLLEHEPVYTIGRTRDQSSLLLARESGIPVHVINRGGQATWHGPGQLVGYAHLDLAERGRDLHRYLRFLEQTVIDTLAGLGLEAGRQERLTGVWVGGRKIASIGVGVRKWVTMHGFALNVCNPPDGFAAITPCGISGVSMTSIARETGQAIAVETVAAAYAETFLRSLTATPDLRDA